MHKGAGAEKPANPVNQLQAGAGPKEGGPMKQGSSQDASIDLETDENKQKIIALFNNNIKGKKFKNKDKTHCGSEGQWLEKLMNLKSNNKNEPDIFGYEMKKESAKITFGDFSASEYLFSKNKDTLDEINNKKIKKL